MQPCKEGPKAQQVAPAPLTNPEQRAAGPRRRELCAERIRDCGAEATELGAGPCREEMRGSLSSVDVCDCLRKERAQDWRCFAKIIQVALAQKPFTLHLAYACLEMLRITAWDLVMNAVRHYEKIFVLHLSLIPWASIFPLQN